MRWSIGIAAEGVGRGHWRKGERNTMDFLKQYERATWRLCVELGIESEKNAQVEDESTGV
jgi:hypothetical protein